MVKTKKDEGVKDDGEYNVRPDEGDHGGNEGAYAYNEMKKMRQEKDSTIKEVLRQNFGATDNDLCDRCAAERTQDGRTKAKPKDRD